MARVITGGAAGEPTVGGITVNSAATVTANTNVDITLDPVGTGRVLVAGDMQLQAQSDLRFADSDSSNYVAFQAASTVASNVTWTLPAADGSSGQSLVTNGSGTLSFTTVGPAITDNTSDSAANYMLFGTVTTGSLTAARVSSTKITFQPSTGRLTTTEIETSGRANIKHVETSTQTGNYTLALTDAGGVVFFNNTSTAQVTVPADGTVNFPVGSIVYVYRGNTGTVELVAGGGVTLTKTGFMASGEQLYLRKRAANNWVVVDIPSTVTFAATGGTIATAGGFRTHSFTSTGSSTLDITVS
jgi:hypothetical protein